MANITLNDKEQAGVTDELAELYRVSPCRETADACARLWLNVFPARVFPETGWAFETSVASPKKKAAKKGKGK